MEPVPTTAFENGLQKGSYQEEVLQQPVQQQSCQNRNQNGFWGLHYQEPWTAMKPVAGWSEGWENHKLSVLHITTKSRLTRKVGMTTIYKKLKSIHTSGSEGIIFRATENIAHVRPTFASLALSLHFCYPSYLLPEPLARANELFSKLHHSSATPREVQGGWLRAEERNHGWGRKNSRKSFRTVCFQLWESLPKGSGRRLTTWVT